MVRKQSFISNLFGQKTYAEFKGFAMLVFLIGTGILIILYALSFFFHVGIINYLLNLTNGYSLLFIGYILAMVILFDIQVDVEEPEKNIWGEEKKEPKPFKYKLTIVWGVFLLILGVVAIYFSNKYRKQYAFECETFLVDKQAHIYHLDWDIDCEAANETEQLEKLYGYQIDDSYTLCEGCEELAEDAKFETGVEISK